MLAVLAHTAGTGHPRTARAPLIPITVQPSAANVLPGSAPSARTQLNSRDEADGGTIPAGCPQASTSFTPQFLFVVEWDNKKFQTLEALGRWAWRAPHHPACAAPQGSCWCCQSPHASHRTDFRRESFFFPPLPPPELLSVALQLPTHPLTRACRWRKALLSKKTSMSSAGP